MFVKAIVGRKGSGKTPIMLDQVESLANDKDSNIVFIEYGKTVDRILPHSVRLIDITEYPVRGYGQLIAFLAGMNAKDYDISHIFIDSLLKIADDYDRDHLDEFLLSLEKFAQRADVEITISISADRQDMTEESLRFLER
ncbi:MAG: hypothetical protein ACOYH0_04765 [Saccharofermentanales bacterium]|nr:hypothetical protein [Clostridiaceae bacterium]HHU97991.1 hypothetical protein [Petrimonas sp.]